MLTSELFTQPNDYSIIQERCSTFIDNSAGYPLLKNLSSTYSSCQKVKVRRRKHSDYISHAFNEAFNKKTYCLRQRAVFTNGESSFIAEHNKNEPFYVFPINGYKFLYSKEVNNSSKDYRNVFESIIDNYGDVDGNKMLTDILKFSYTSNHLSEGIQSGSEIILYNIPFYYAIKVSSVPSYDSLC